MTIRYRRLLWVLVQLASLILHTTGERHLAGPIGNLTNTSPPRQEVVRRGEDGENSIEVMDSTQQVNNLLSSTQNIYTLDKRGDGKGMSRHLAAASYGAMLAMGTAAMGVTTYGIRLFDWNRYKKQIYTHSRETVSKQHLKDLRKGKNLGGSKSGSELKDVIPTHTTIIINNFINYNRNLQNNSNPHNSTVKRRNTEEGKLSAASNKENEGAQIYAGDNFLVPQTGDQTAGLTLFIKQATLMRRAERLEVRLQGLHKNTRDRAPIYSSRQMPGAATVSKNKTLYHIKRSRVNYAKFDKWASLAAKIEDYGKVSATTAAFLAGALSLYATSQEHVQLQAKHEQGPLVTQHYYLSKQPIWANEESTGDSRKANA